MAEKVKFVTITRTINVINGIHYLDAVDENGQHWESEMSSRLEGWLVYTKMWRKSAQQPYNV